MRTHLILLAAAAALLAACGHTGGAPLAGDESMVQTDEQSVATITRDIEFMAFLHRFAEDPDFQMQHIKFPLGKLSYANIFDEEGETFYPDDFTERYWLLSEGEYMRDGGAGYFTWVNDNKIVYDYNCSLLEDCWAEFGDEYTFEKIDGEWYVTAGDYYGSDVGIADYQAGYVASQNELFRKEHTEPYTPYEYNGTPGDYPQASERRLTEQDLQGMDSKQLRLMRNEIMARHGYAFKNEDLKKHFNEQPWYFPLFLNVDGALSDIEKENVTFIKAHERTTKNERQ